MPVFDNDLMFASSGNLTKTASFPTAGLKIRSTPVEGLAARIMVPDTPGLSAQLLFAIHGSADDSTYRILSTYEGGAQSWASGTKEYILPFETTLKYVKLFVTVSGGSTAADWGAWKSGIVSRVMGDWSRTVDWS